MEAGDVGVRGRERVRKEAGGGKCGCQTLASVHPLFYMRASTGASWVGRKDGVAQSQVSCS